MQTTIGCTSRLYNQLSNAESYVRIGVAGYAAVRADEGQISACSDTSAAEHAAVRRAAL